VDSELSIRSLSYEYFDCRDQDIDASLDSRDSGNFHRVLHMYVDFESAERVFDTVSAVESQVSARSQLAPAGSDERFQLELFSGYLACLKLASFCNIQDKPIESTLPTLKVLLEMELRKCRNDDDAAYFRNAIKEL
jgi:hypothetical protein